MNTTQESVEIANAVRQFSATLAQRQQLAILMAVALVVVFIGPISACSLAILLFLITSQSPELLGAAPRGQR